MKRNTEWYQQSRYGHVLTGAFVELYKINKPDRSTHCLPCIVKETYSQWFHIVMKLKAFVERQAYFFTRFLLIWCDSRKAGNSNVMRELRSVWMQHYAALVGFSQKCNLSSRATCIWFFLLYYAFFLFYIFLCCCDLYFGVTYSPKNMLIVCNCISQTC